MQTKQIRALTGIRFFAALWVVLYHVSRANRPYLKSDLAPVFDLISPVIGRGTLGVDLFFMLSGYVLALNYLHSLGPRFTPRLAIRFLWLRLARVWPVYVAVLIGAGGLIRVRSHVWHAATTDSLTPMRFLRQLTMTQLWTSPTPDLTSWAGPAWSLSAEWLAYLFFPFLALVVYFLTKRLPAPAIVALAPLMLAPLVYILFTQGQFGHSYAWIARILCEFTAGVFLAAGLTRISFTDRQRAIAGGCATTVAVAIFGWMYAAPHLFDRFVWGTLVLLLFLPLIGFLAIGTGPFVSLLSTRALVTGGGLSYSLYLIHSPLLHLFRDLGEFTRLGLSPAQNFVGEVLMVPVLIGLAWLVFHYFEEPARRFMRRLMPRALRDSPQRPVDRPDRSSGVPSAPSPSGS